MQSTGAALLGLSFLAALAPAGATRVSRASAPGVERVLAQIEELQSKIQGEVKAEQKEYDKYACWCESTLATKATEIEDHKKLIAELQVKILKYKGILGVTGAEIEQLTRDISANEKATAEAEAMRKKEAAAYNAEKVELEQCIGALEAAISVLSGAGEKKDRGAELLSSIQQAQLLSTVAGVREVLTDARVKHMVDERDIQVVQDFLAKPSDFILMQSHQGAAFLQGQVGGPNPFGDYAPKSGQIQGILKEMYDSFCKDLEKADASEGEKSKIFQALIETKAEELRLLKDQLEKYGFENGDTIQSLATDTSERDITKKALKEATEYFAEVKAECQEKATAWSIRTKLRTDELDGIQKAIDILKSPEAKEVFGSSLLQVSAPHHVLLKVHKIVTKADLQRTHAYEQLSGLATKYGTLSLANLAAEVKLSGGHFDRVISMIDKLIRVLEQDNKDDEKHKEYCEKETAKNEAEKEDLEKLIEKTDKAIELRKEQIGELEGEISGLDDKMNSTKTELKELSDSKSEQTKDYNKGTEDNKLALRVLAMAMEAISKFYRAHGLVEMQTSAFHADAAAGPAAPVSETNWDKTEYSKEDAKGASAVMGVLQSIMEDIKKDMELAKGEEEASMKDYQGTRQKMIDLVGTDQELRNAKAKERAVHEKKMSFEEQDLQQANVDKETVEKVLAALAEECAWVETHFESRMDKRKAEIEGLGQAKRILQGAAATMD